MRKIFANKGLEEAISRKGYVILQEMVSDETCDNLAQFFTQNDIADQRAFTISNWNHNSDYRDMVFKKITETLMPFSLKFIDNYKPVMGVFTVKRPGTNSDMLLHQDWTLVDEVKFRSISLWVALCDMDYSNGNLQVVERSHIYAGYPRGMNTPVLFERIRGILHDRFLTDLPLKKGDAVVFDHRLIHASPENGSNQIRLAAVMAMIPDEAQLIHYYKPPSDNHRLEILKMDPDQFRQVDFFDMPNKPKHEMSLGEIPAVFSQITIDDIERLEHEQTAE